MGAFEHTGDQTTDQVSFSNCKIRHRLKIMAALSFCLVLVLASCFAYTWVKASPDEYSLRNDLFMRYDDIRRRTRPVINYNDNVSVTHGLVLQGFDFSTRSKNFEGTFIQYMKWRVPELTWDPMRYGNIRVLSMFPDQVWLPDIFLHNNEYAGQQKGLKIPVPLLLNSSGYISWEDPAALSFKCTDKRSAYPAATSDTRWICQMIFRSWTLPRNLLDMQLSSLTIDLSEVAPHPAWAITFTRGERIEAVRTSQITHGIDLYYWIGLKSPWL